MTIKKNNLDFDSIHQSYNLSKANYIVQTTNKVIKSGIGPIMTIVAVKYGKRDIKQK